jgi:amino acid transporter
MATVTSVVAVVIYAVRGPDTFARLGVTLASTVSLYLIAGVVGGALVGVLLPVTVWRWGAAAVGILAAVPLYVGVAVVLGQSDLLSGLIAAVLVGGVVGYGLWSPANERTPPGT